MRTRSPGKIGVDYTPSIVRQIAAIPDGLQDNDQIQGFTELKIKPRNFFYSKSSKVSYYEYYVIYDESYYKDRWSDYIEQISESDRYEANISAGCPHFFIGADKGLLRNFSFQKSDFGEALAVVRNFEEGNPYKQLWSQFNVTLELVGNNLVSVGQNIFLDPTITGLGSPFKSGTVSNLMGLGGYYLVQNVQHDYYTSWRTTVQATVIIPASQQGTYSQGVPFEFY